MNPPCQDSALIVDQRVELVSLCKARDAAADSSVRIFRVLPDLDRLAVNEQNRRRWPAALDDVDELAHERHYIGPTQSPAHRRLIR